MNHDADPSTADAAIYLDHNATTPIAPEVLDAMRPYLEDRFGNPSSAHRYGAVAHRTVESARAQVAALLGCEQDSIVFTASGSEADNLAIKGVALGFLGEGDHITSRTPTTRSARSSRSSTSPPLRASIGSPAIPMRRNRWARSRSTSTSSMWTC